MLYTPLPIYVNYSQILILSEYDVSSPVFVPRIASLYAINCAHCLRAVTIATSLLNTSVEPQSDHGLRIHYEAVTRNGCLI
jgi:hypothetical protein